MKPESDMTSKARTIWSVSSLTAAATAGLFYVVYAGIRRSFSSTFQQGVEEPFGRGRDWLDEMIARSEQPVTKPKK